MLAMLEKQNPWALAENNPSINLHTGSPLGRLLCHTSTSQWSQNLHSYSQNGLHSNKKNLETRA